MIVTRCTCPHCSSKLKTARPQEVGKVIKCPKCNRTFPVAQDESAADTSPAKASSAPTSDKRPKAPEERPEFWEDLTDSGPPPEQPAELRRPEGRRKANPWVLPVSIGGGVLALALVGGILVYGLRQGIKAPGPVARANAPGPTVAAPSTEATIPPEEEPAPDPAGAPSAPEPVIPVAATTAPGPAGAPPRKGVTKPAEASRPDETPGSSGDEVNPVPIGQAYGAGQGPGITVVAGGAVRLYVDGALLAEETEAGKPKFVPLTLLPGKHTVAVLGSKGSAPPGVLIQVDELEKPYPSGPGWKVSSAPGGSWKDKAFDDSGWEEAAVTGDLTTRPATGLPAGVLEPSARWIWSPRPGDAQVALRYTFTIRAEGYAQDVTGGDGGRIVVVKTADEIAQLLASADPLILLIPEGVYDFRQKQKTMAAANPNDPKDPSKGVNLRIVVGEGFGRDPGAKMVEVERWDRRILVKGNKTILGLGRGAFLRGASLTVSGARNVIFRNLCVFDVNPHLIEAGDGISADDAEGLWVDHCTFRWISDGCDLAGDRGSRAVTFSWIHYNGANEWTIAGRQHFASMVLNSEATYHHVWWESVNGRAPKVTKDRSRVHVYNNYYTDNDYHEVASSEGAQVLLEGCYFDGVKIPTMRETGGLIRSRDNVFKNITWSHFLDKKPGPEPKDDVFAPPYQYTPDPAAAVPALLRSRAGVGGRWGTEPKY
jgi:pectate lyase